MSIVSRRRFFVYTLARPDGRVFYVGKGTKKRPYQHIFEAQRGDCHCKKCMIIRQILSARKEVKIDILFETDDEREAYSREEATIRELCQIYRLTNKLNRIGLEVIPAPPRPIAHLVLDEVRAYLDWIDATPKERDELLREWAWRRLNFLKPQITVARLARRFDEVDQLQAEVGRVVDFQMQGFAYQHKLQLF